MTGALCAAISEATQMIRGAIYDCNSLPIVAALGMAAERGVNVAIVMDDLITMREYEATRTLARSGVAVRLDRRHNCMHHKYLVIDGNRVLTGSSNWTVNADLYNAELLLDIEACPRLATQMLADWQYHFGHSVDWTARPAPNTLKRAADIARLLRPT